jgi:hypothetical protein
MYTKRRFIAALLIACAGAASACGDDDGGVTGPTGEGSVRVIYSSPSNTDGAILLTVSGAAVEEPRVVGSGQYLSYRIVDSRTMRVAIAGNLSSGALLTFDVPDVRRAGDYRVTIDQAATRSNELIGNLSGYAATVEVVD